MQQALDFLQGVISAHSRKARHHKWTPFLFMGITHLLACQTYFVIYYKQTEVSSTSSRKGRLLIRARLGYCRLISFHDMDNKKIIEKALKGEDYSADIKDFTPEQKTAFNLELSNTADSEARTNLAKAQGLRKSAEEAERKAQEGNKGQSEQFRKEQVDKAASRLFTQFSIPEDKRQSILETFKKIDSGKIDSDLIFNDLKIAYAASNADTLIDAETKVKEGVANAARHNAGAAFSQNFQPTPDGKEYSKEAKALVTEGLKKGIVIKIEDAERIAKQGFDRKL